MNPRRRRNNKRMRSFKKHAIPGTRMSEPRNCMFSGKQPSQYKHSWAAWYFRELHFPDMNRVGQALKTLSEGTSRDIIVHNGRGGLLRTKSRKK